MSEQLGNPGAKTERWYPRLRRSIGNFAAERFGVLTEKRRAEINSQMDALQARTNASETFIGRLARQLDIVTGSAKPSIEIEGGDAVREISWHAAAVKDIKSPCYARGFYLESASIHRRTVVPLDSSYPSTDQLVLSLTTQGLGRPGLAAHVNHRITFDLGSNGECLQGGSSVGYDEDDPALWIGSARFSEERLEAIVATAEHITTRQLVAEGGLTAALSAA